jgi:transposase
MERKAKYSYEFKLQCVAEVLKNHRSLNSVAISKGFSESILSRRWISFYRKFGNDGLLPRKNQKYSPDLKLKVLQTLNKDTLSLNQACLKFNIPSDSIILNWQRNYNNEGFNGLIDKTKGRPVMSFKRVKKKTDKPLSREEELLKEIEYLRAENELLKKFNALVQSKELQQQKRLKP